MLDNWDIEGGEFFSSNSGIGIRSIGWAGEDIVVEWDASGWTACGCSWGTLGTWTLVSSSSSPPQLSATPENNGDNPSCPTPLRLDPINTATGDKFEAETDYAGAGSAAGLTLQRYYNSMDKMSSAFGANWRDTWHRALPYTAASGSTPATVKVARWDGRVDTFTQNTSGPWTTDPNVLLQLTAVLSTGNVQTGWQVTRDDDSKELYTMDGRLVSITTRGGLVTALTYDANNRLTQVADPFGHTLSFAYNASNLISQVTQPDGKTLGYGYDANNNLTSVTYPDGTTRQYLYENTAFPHALTGIIDEKGVRFETTTYDSNGLAVSTQRAGLPTATVAYNQDGSANVTDANGSVQVLTFANTFNLLRPATMTQSCCGGASYTYDSNGFLASITDFNGNITNITHNAKGQEISRTEAAGNPQARTTTTVWHATFNLPIQINELGRTTNLGYDTLGNLITKTIIAGNQSRAWTYAYNAMNQLTSITGPLGDVSKFGYDTSGNLASITDALGHVTNVTQYDANGRPLSMTDPNGLVTTFAYDARGRQTQRNAGGEKTLYFYDLVGDLDQVTMPDGSVYVLGYDAAHRLISVTDSLGNQIVLTRDGNSNVIAENVYDSKGNLTQTRGHAYDAMNHVIQDIGALGQATKYTRDANGNITSVTDPLGYVTNIVVDALNRAVQSTDPNGGVTQVGYNALDQILSVTDPRYLVTKYNPDALGDPLSVQSPDSGTTANAFDAAGNIVSTTDAKGQTTRITYDLLYRPTSVKYADGKMVNYIYDLGTNAIGHLTWMIDPSGFTAYGYDQHGRVTTKVQYTGLSFLTNQYTYDAAGRLATETYPSGMTATYLYDVVSGKPSGILVNGKTLVSNITYQPFGPMASWATGSGLQAVRTFDLDGLITAQAQGTDSLNITYNAAGQITGIVKPGMTEAFGYDPADRLTNYASNSANTAYFLDVNGNRTGQSMNGATTTFGIDPASNRTQSMTIGSTTQTYNYDADGNQITDGPLAFTVNAEGRVASIMSGGVITRYDYNGMNERVSKTGSAIGGTEYFAYDENRQLLGEYQLSGLKMTAQQETIYLDGVPIGIVKNGALYNDLPGTLGEPRRITDASGNLVWSWDHDPFGNNAPNQKPGKAAAFVYNLRLPGQQTDAESGLNYNLNRTYNPAMGRYTQTDPIGLAGGINPYLYVAGNPVSLIDPLGLCAGDTKKCMDNYLRNFAGDTFGNIFDKSVQIFSLARPFIDNGFLGGAEQIGSTRTAIPAINIVARTVLTISWKILVGPGATSATLYYGRMMIIASKGLVRLGYFAGGLTALGTLADTIAYAHCYGEDAKPCDPCAPSGHTKNIPMLAPIPN
jgi:RHS repeat-associated protein